MRKNFDIERDINKAKRVIGSVPVAVTKHTSVINTSITAAPVVDASALSGSDTRAPIIPPELQYFPLEHVVSRSEEKERIYSEFGASVCEMEGAAIAHTAWKNGVPFVIIRAISDKADDSAQMDYPTFEAQAAQRCAQVTKEMAKSLAE